jgi:hypothetical protein
MAFVQKDAEGASAYVTSSSGSTKDDVLGAFAAATNNQALAKAVQDHPGAFQLLYRNKPIEGRTTLGDVGAGDCAELKIYLKLKGGAGGDSLEENREEDRRGLIAELRAFESRDQLEQQYTQGQLEAMCKQLNVHYKDKSSAGLSRVLFATFQPVRCVKRKSKEAESTNVDEAMAGLAADPEGFEVRIACIPAHIHTLMHTYIHAHACIQAPVCMHSQACVEEQPTHTDAQHRQAPTPYETVDQLIRRLSATTPEALAAEADRPALMGFAKRLGVTGYGKMTTDQLVTVVINAAKTAQQRKSQFFSKHVGNAPTGAKRKADEPLPDPTDTPKHPRSAEVSERGCL